MWLYVGIARARDRRRGNFPLRALGEKSHRASRRSRFRQRNAGGNDHPAFRHLRSLRRARFCGASATSATPLGLEADEIAKQGGLVPDDIIVRLIEDWLNLHGKEGFVFDGFPRTVTQAERLNEILAEARDAARSRALARSLRGNRARSHRQPAAMSPLRFHDQPDEREVSPIARSVPIATGR